MRKLRVLTAGESHGRGLAVIVEGLPADIEIGEAQIERALKRRQYGFGSGGRMKIEDDKAQIKSGVRHGKTLGSPIALWIENKDFVNWREAMSIEEVGADVDRKRFANIVPGHADFAGALKYAQHDLRNVLERASARETAARVAAGALASQFLNRFGVSIRSRVVSIGAIEEPPRDLDAINWGDVDECDVRTDLADLADKYRRAILNAKNERTTIGGVIQVIAFGAPVGLGSHVHWDRKLDAAIAGALISINAAKGVEIGAGFANTKKFGRDVHDVLAHAPEAPTRFKKLTNRAGGIEGGMSNGAPIVANVAIKAISTMTNPLPSVDINTGESVPAKYNRSDICQVPRACPIAEAMLALTLADAMLDKFGGDSIAETKRNYDGYIESHGEFGRAG